jgi:hypothetical protein
MMSGKPLHDAAPIVGILVILAGLAVIATWCQGCDRPAQHPAYCTDEHAFTARQLACVDDAARIAKDEESFRNASRVCRAALHERCGIVFVSARDGGAP